MDLFKQAPYLYTQLVESLLGCSERRCETMSA